MSLDFSQTGIESWLHATLRVRHLLELAAAPGADSGHSAADDSGGSPDPGFM